MKKTRKQAGFTLIELIIVIAIIGILAAIAIPNYLAFRDRAQIAAAETSLGGLRTALEAYRADKGTYPTELDLSTGSPLTVTPTYYDNWNSFLANISGSPSGSIQRDDYVISVTAKDRNNTTVTATPGGIQVVTP